MVMLETGTRMDFTLARLMMRSFSQLLPLEFVRILKLESKNSLVDLKSTKMLINIFQTILSIRMILPL